MTDEDNVITEEYTVKHFVFVDRITHTYKNRVEYFNNKKELHRLDGPAIEWKNGHKYWYQNGKLHRLDGPAIEMYNGTKYWYVNGLKHRLDGPAIIGGSKTIADSIGKDSYWICGVEYTETEFKKVMNIK